MGKTDFTQLGIAPGLLEIIRRLGFSTPTPIQEQSIPSAIEGKDLVGIAQTGTGKTLAFGVPMIQRLAGARRAGEPVSRQGLVVVPTRELALQVDEALRKLGSSIGLKTAVLIGGAGMMPQITALRRSPNIIVATPGRLIDHLNQKNVSLARVSVLVLDEADRMLDMGFLPQIKKILDALPKERQTMLFSATMPRGIMNIATRYMKAPVRVEVAPSGTAPDLVTQELFIVPKEQKQHLLNTLLKKTNGSTLIFSRTKYGAKKIMRNVKVLGITAAEIHSNRTLGQRKEALEGFKMGKYRVLVATDIASRGIDVLGIALVINYDLPGTPDDYVHRIGRTARAGETGHAITFASASELRGVRDIERLIRQPIPKSTLPELPRVAAKPARIPNHTRQRPARWR
ncbi:MAG: DEAD/DEAH box helicase [Parcubacteria group bacterium]|nr:DEAD/DEAH box helicase [Parcubacteria group bacterium]